MVAEATTADPAASSRLLRNRGIIQTLVDGGIRIAREDDSLRRADSCSDLARGLAVEVRQAAGARDSDRAVEMGQHLHDLLQSGVARNIRSVRSSAPEVSLAQKEKMEQVATGLVPCAQRGRSRVGQRDEADPSSHPGARKEVEKAVRG